MSRNDLMRRFTSSSGRVPGLLLAAGAIPVLLIIGFVVYTWFRIDVPAKHFAVLTRKTGENLENGEEVAPDDKHKGLQLEVLPEGRYFYNPYYWSWSVHPMIEIPREKMGIRVRLYGKDLAYGDFLAPSVKQEEADETNETDQTNTANTTSDDEATNDEATEFVDDEKVRGEEYKGIIEEVLKPGRYAINALVIDKDTKKPINTSRRKSDYVEIIELWEPKVIPAGYKGIVTNLAGPLPENPNVLLVEKGFRGPQEKPLEPGTYYLNPYMYRINAIDTRSQRFNLSEGKDMTFPSKDGFPISLDGIIEFRVIPEFAAKTYVTYNDVSNDLPGASAIAEEIIAKVIMPNARAFCRLRGSNSSARDFIGGETRTAFQNEFQQAITDTCEAQGIEIVQALITKIKPPQAIAEPLRDREVAAQQLKQFTQEILQQEQEAKLATEKELIEQKKELIGADRKVIEAVTLAKEEQEVKLEGTERDRAVATEKLAAAKDEAEAILSRAAAKAAVIGFENEADAAGWKKAVEALGNDGDAYARYVLFQKLAPGYRSIMTNTADSPLMEVFRNLAPKEKPAVDSSVATPISKN